MATISRRSNGKFQAKIRRNGYPDQSKTFRTQKEAKMWSREIETKMDQSIFKSTKDAQIKMMDDALEEYYDEKLKKKKSAKNIKYSINRLKRVFSGLSMFDVSVQTIREFKSYRLEQVKGDTVRKEMSLIQRMFTHAINEWQIYLPEGNPVSPVSLPAKGKQRDRRFKAGEEKSLLFHAKKYQGDIHDIIILAIETGMRRGEIVNSRDKQALSEYGYACMCWENFNELDSTILLIDTKNDENRTVPLSPKAKQIILSQPRKLSGPIFKIRGDSVGQAFRRVTNRAGIKNFRFHDLRHEATSRLFEKGLQMIEVASITGHRDLASLKRYTHLNPADLAKKLA